MKKNILMILLSGIMAFLFLGCGSSKNDKGTKCPSPQVTLTLNSPSGSKYCSEFELSFLNLTNGKSYSLPGYGEEFGTFDDTMCVAEGNYTLGSITCLERQMTNAADIPANDGCFAIWDGFKSVPQVNMFGDCILYYRDVNATTYQTIEFTPEYGFVPSGENPGFTFYDFTLEGAATVNAISSN
jgi:hypothetical protein